MYPNFIAIDTEATGLCTWRGHRMFACAGTFADGRQLYWYKDFEDLQKILEDTAYDKVFQNAKFDLQMLEASGFKVKGHVWDTIILAHLLDGRQQLSLDALAKRYLPLHRSKITDEVNQWFDDNKVKKEDRGTSFDKLPLDLLKRRCKGDATLTALLFIKMYKTAKSTFPFLLDQEHRLIAVVKKAEKRGLNVDIEEAIQQRMYLKSILNDTQVFFDDYLGREVNINSTKIQQEIIEKANITRLITELTPKTKVPKLSSENLRAIGHPVAQMLVLQKTAAYLHNTFIGQILNHTVDSVLHPGFNQCGTVSGRFSSSNPNLLNIPSEEGHLSEKETNEALEFTGINLAPHIKRIFKVRPGFAHIHSDKSKIEIAMLAHYSEDPALLHTIRAGEDIHGEISFRMFGTRDPQLRQRAKNVVFGYIYGAGDLVLARKIQGTLREARTYRMRLLTMCPGLKRWKQHLCVQLYDRGYIQTLHGRRHCLTSAESYMAVNRMCQGTAADEVKNRMRVIGEWFASEYPECTILLNIHDDLAAEVPIPLLPEVLPKYHKLMQETQMDYILPLVTKTSITYTNWAELNEVDTNAKGDIVYDFNTSTIG